MEGPECNGIVKIDVSHMKDGDVADSGFQRTLGPAVD